MKTPIFVLVLWLSLAACNHKAPNNEATNGQDSEQTGGGSIAIENEFFDFGKLTNGEVVTHKFTFTNKGTEDLIVKHVQVSCGCTTPDYTREPIPPGGQGFVTLSYNSAGFHGKVNKSATIFTNGDPSEATLHFSAEIE